METAILTIILNVLIFFWTICIRRKVLSESKKSNDISKEALERTTLHFTSLNKPLLIAKPVSFQNNGAYFLIEILNEKTLSVRIPISINNVGNLVADNILLKSKQLRLYLGNNKLADLPSEEESPLSGRLTLMDLPPNDGVVKIIDFIIQLPEVEIERVQKELTSARIDINILLHYYSHLKEEQPYTSNISYAIGFNWFSVMMLKL